MISPALAAAAYEPMKDNNAAYNTLPPPMPTSHGMRSSRGWSTSPLHTGGTTAGSALLAAKEELGEALVPVDAEAESEGGGRCAIKRATDAGKTKGYLSEVVHAHPTLSPLTQTPTLRPPPSWSP